MSLRLFSVFCCVFVLGCGASHPRFTTRQPDARRPEAELQGVASYYAEEFNGRKTASGETYDMNGFTAAHRSLPFGAKVRVRNLENNREVEVRINDRGPFKENRVIDLSFGAAKVLGLIARGTARVLIEVLDDGSTGEQR